MILSQSMNRPEHVWCELWHYLSDGILFEQRQLTKDTDNYDLNYFLIQPWQLLHACHSRDMCCLLNS